MPKSVARKKGMDNKVCNAIKAHNIVGLLLTDITTITAGYTPDVPSSEYLELKKQSDETNEFMYLFDRYCCLREQERESGSREKIIMQTKFTYIEFIKIGEVSRAVPIFRCQNIKNKDDLGMVQFYAPWKQFCYYPINDIVLNETCINDISFFVSQCNNPTVAMHPDHIKMLDELLKVEEGLNDEEMRFIGSLDRQRQKALTTKQASWLKNIWNKLFH